MLRPVQINESLLKKILSKKVKSDYLEDLTTVEKGILLKMLEYGKPITPTEISKITKKKLTNISALYLPKLRRKTAIEIIGREGRNIYYEVRPEIRWLLLEEKNVLESNDMQIKDFIEKKLTEYVA